MTSDALKAFAWRTFATAAALVAGIISLRLYSQYLSPQSFGVVLLALQMLAYLSLLDGGYRTTTNRKLLSAATSSQRFELIRWTQTFYAWLSIAVLIVAVTAMATYSFTPLAKAEPSAFFVVVGVAAALAFVSSAQTGLLVGLQAQAACFMIAGLNSIINTLALWLSFRGGMGIWAFPISTLAGVCFIYPVTLLILRRVEPSIHFFPFHVDPSFWNYFHSLKQDAFACFRSQVSIMLLFTIDVVLVGLLCGAADAAIYGVLSRIFGIIRGFLQATGEVAWPLLARGAGRSG